MPKLMFTLLVSALSLGQFSVVSQGLGFKVYGFDIAAGLYLVIGTIFLLISRKGIILPKRHIPFYLFLFVCLAGLILNLNSYYNFFTFALFYFVRFILYLGSVLVTYNFYIHNYLSLDFIYKVFILSGIFLGFGGILQLIFLPDFTVLSEELGWDPHKNRLASTFFDPNFVGAYFVLCLNLLFFKDYLFSSMTKSFLIFLLLVFTVLTFSRSAWGMLMVSVFIYGYFKNPKVIVISIFVAFLAYFAVPRIQTRISGVTDPADSASFRLVSWSNTMKIAQDNILLGVGYNNFKQAQIDYGFLDPDTQEDHSATGSDSSLLLVLATTGVLGFLFFFLGFASPLIFRNIMLISLFFSLFLGSQFINSLFYPQIMFLWLTLYAVE